MPRDSSGTYTPNPSTPFVTGTPIASSVANTRAADLATEITDSLSRSGKGGMLAPIAFTGIAATIRSGIANGASAVAHILDSVASLTTAGAKLLSLRNAGVEKFYVDKDGNAYAGGTQLDTVKAALQVSASSGAFTTSSTAYVDVTNLSVTVAATGRPVLLLLQSDGTADSAEVGAGGNFDFDVRILLDGITTVAEWRYFDSASGRRWASFPSHVHAPAAGNRTYKVQAKSPTGTVQALSGYVLVAREI